MNTELQHDIFSGLPTEKLTPNEEAACAQFKNYDKLILYSLREAVLYAGRCARGRIESGELLSLCYEALRKSAPRWRPGGITFLAYSKADLRGEISRYYKSQDPVHNSYLHEDEEKPQIVRLGKSDRNTYDNSDETGFEGDDVDTLEPNFAEPEWNAIAIRERWDLVKPIIDKYLNERERMILALIYESGFTFEEIGKMLVPRVYRQAVEMSHARALRKIRNVLLRRKQLYSTV